MLMQDGAVKAATYYYASSVIAAWKRFSEKSWHMRHSDWMPEES